MEFRPGAGRACPAPTVEENADYYTWDGPVTFRISAEALDRIVADAIRGMGLLPRRGVEVGGLLLGRAGAGARASATVDDVLAVPIEYAFGPSYKLSERDRERLKDVLRCWERSPSRPTYAIGFYRTQTRDGLTLTAEDLRLFSDYFTDPISLALLVRPGLGQSEAALFVRDADGEFRADTSYVEFTVRSGGAKDPARRPAARSGETGFSPESEMAPPLGDVPLNGGQNTQAEACAEAAPEGTEARRRQPFWVSWWIQVPILVVLLVVDGLFGFVAARQVHSAPAEAQRTAKDPYALSLLVVEYGDNLHLTWDHNAPALASAESAVLSITDGDQTQSLDLSLEQLRNSSVSYRRLSTRVKLRLEVRMKGKRSVSETWELSSELP